MVGLLTENGPCRLNDDEKTVSLNPYSFNQVSNVWVLLQCTVCGTSSLT